MKTAKWNISIQSRVSGRFCLSWEKVERFLFWWSTLFEQMALGLEMYVNKWHDVYQVTSNICLYLCFVTFCSVFHYVDIVTGVSSGHYTAYAKNCVSGEWWYYNDDVTTQQAPTTDDHVNNAYVLFYQKQGRFGEGAVLQYVFAWH